MIRIARYIHDFVISHTNVNDEDGILCTYSANGNTINGLYLLNGGQDRGQAKQAPPLHAGFQEDSSSGEVGSICFRLLGEGADAQLKAFKAEAPDHEIAVDVVEEGDPYHFRLPDNIIRDVNGMRDRLKKSRDNNEDALQFRSYHVPMGVYDQRMAGTFMTRVRLTGGILNTRQLRVLAEAAETYGNGILHLTTRQAIQIHDIAITEMPDLADLILKEDLVSRGGCGDAVRNVTSDPYAGVDVDEPFDVTPYVLAVTDFLLKKKDSFRLPRKFKIAFSSNKLDRGFTSISDVGFMPKVVNGKKGFSVHAGGGMGSTPTLAVKILDFIPDGHVFHMSEAIKQIFSQNGDREKRSRARLKFVLKRFGEEKFREVIIQRYNQLVEKGLETVPLPRKAIYDLRGEVLDSIPDYASRQKVPGLYSLMLSPPLGNLPVSVARSLADIIDSYKLEVRVHMAQGLVLRNVKGQHLETLIGELNNQEISLLQPLPARRPVVCTGAPGCKLAVCESRGLGKLIAEKLEYLDDSVVAKFPPIHISGCPNSCGQHPIGILAFSGRLKRIKGTPVPHYRIWVGNGETHPRTIANGIGDLPAEVIPDFLEGLAQVVADSCPEEKTFAQLVEQDDYRQVKELIQQYKAVPVTKKGCTVQPQAGEG